MASLEAMTMKVVEGRQGARRIQGPTTLLGSRVLSKRLAAGDFSWWI